VLGDQAGEPNALSRAVIDALASIGLAPNPGVLLGILVGGMLVESALLMLALRQVGHAVADVVTRMRLDVIEAVMEARWSFYTRQPTGRFTHALSSEAGQAGAAYNAAALFVGHCIEAVVFLAVAAAVSWKVALLALAVSAFIVVSLNRLLISAKRTAREQTWRMQRMLARLTDVLVGLKPMKAMGRHARFSELFLRDADEIKQIMRRQVFTRNANRAVQEPILAVCLAGGLYVALTHLTIPVGELLVMSLVLAKTVHSVGRAQQSLQQVYIAQSGFDAVRRTIRDARRARETSSGKVAPTLENAVEGRGLSFGFTEPPIVEDASFTLCPGELTALIGPSGTGKTTLVDIILGFYQPLSGEVLVDGVPLAELDIPAWRRMTGYVPQELILFHDTVMANITLGECGLSRADVERALRLAGAWEFIARLPEGMDSVVGERGALLSGGERQRIAIARALVHRPRLLILDEATSALDPETEAQAIRGVRELVEETGVVALAISHHAAWGEVAHQIMRLEQGRLECRRCRPGVHSLNTLRGTS
jgi:ATP-binding cassette subfamily C protein